MAHWEHFEHAADIGVRGIGATLEQAFGQAAEALTAVITDPRCVAATQSIEIRCEADDIELLFFDWINELIFAMAVHRLLFSQYQITISDRGLKATAYGEPINTSKHRPTVEIKGATFTEMRVGQQADGQWFAQCIVDV